MLHVENDLAEFAKSYLNLKSSLRRMGWGIYWGELDNGFGLGEGGDLHY
jgi:hypothetical protein